MTRQTQREQSGDPTPVRVGFVSQAIDVRGEASVFAVCRASMTPRSLWVPTEIASQFVITEITINDARQAGICGEVIASQFESERHVEGNVLGAPILLDDVHAGEAITIKVRKIAGVPGQYARFIAVLFGESVGGVSQ